MTKTCQNVGRKGPMLGVSKTAWVKLGECGQGRGGVGSLIKNAHLCQESGGPEVWWRREMEEEMFHFSKLWISERRVWSWFWKERIQKQFSVLLSREGAGLGDDECFYTCNEGFHHPSPGFRKSSENSHFFQHSERGIFSWDVKRPETKLPSVKPQTTNPIQLGRPRLAFYELLLTFSASMSIRPCLVNCPWHSAEHKR